MIVVAFASMILLATGSWAVCSRARRAWRQQRAFRREVARGIARLEIMLQEREDRTGPQPGWHEGESGSTSAPNPPIA